MSLFAGGLVLYFLLALFLFASEWLWPEFNGSYDLGNNIYMLEYDGGGKIIVNASTISGRTCYGGETLIPTYENQYDSTGNFAEYVVEAKSDDKWIIVKTNNRRNDQRKYYILDKQYNYRIMSSSDIIGKKITCFTDSAEFAKGCLCNGIKINWEQ